MSVRARELKWLSAGAVQIFLVALALAPACQLVGGYQSFSPHPCSVLPASKLDDKQIATLVLSKQPDGNCYWIDRTEVTVQQYSQFVADPTPISWDANCRQWKTTAWNPAAPAAESDPCTVSTKPESEAFALTKPVRCIDWCDAKAFCHWAGKDLCGGQTNGSFVGPSDVFEGDQWGKGCSADGLPYLMGATPVLDQCNVGLAEAGQCASVLMQPVCAPTNVGAFPQCTAPSGAVDLIGNVAEWVLSCGNSDGGPDTMCQYRGGSFADSLAEASCYTPLNANPAATRDRGLGFRCCALLTLDESNLVMRATSP
jgi:hypothetical protein